MSGEIRTNRATNETQSFRLDFGVCSCALYFRCESLGFEMWNVRIQKIYFRAFTHYANREDDNLSCIRALMRSTKSPSSDATRTQTHKSVKFCFTQHIIHFLVYLTIAFVTRVASLMQFIQSCQRAYLHCRWSWKLDDGVIGIANTKALR